MKHYANRNKTTCGIELQGEAKRYMTTGDLLLVDCTSCVFRSQKIQDAQNRERERLAHLEIKNFWEIGLSWQEAHLRGDY